jgi:Zn-dependent peptidase ImmA (M78 family)/DNA-binding XRE family transcriptional regulator
MLGSRMRQLRLARGWTLEELSHQMNGVVTKQALSKWEADKAFPRPTALIALAHAFGVKGAELIAEPEYSIACLEYRSRAPLAPRTRERVEASLSTSLERRLRLEDRLGASRDCALPRSRSVASLEEAEDAARSLRAAWGLGAEAIANLSDVLEARSVHVFELAGENDFDGLAAVATCEDGSIRGVGIAENPDTDGDRQRFNLAHELGHVLMDVDPVLDEERAANRFAGGLLVPRELVFEEVGRRRSEMAWEELLLLKRLWGVSIQSILHRLWDLDVISESHFDWWMREIKALGYQKREPVRLPREESTWEARRLAHAEAEGLLSREQAAVYAAPRPARVEQASVERRSLMKMSIEDRRAVLRAHAERLSEYYEEEARGEWVNGGFDGLDET